MIQHGTKLNQTWQEHIYSYTRDVSIACFLLNDADRMSFT